MHRLISTIRRTIRAALSAGQALVAAASRRSFQLLVTLFRAADQGAAVRIGYRKECGAISERVIEPGEPYPTEAGHIVFRGHDRLRGKSRTFRVDRIVSYQPAA